MIDQLIIVEIAVRGAAAGLNVLLAGLLLFSRPPGLRRVLGAMFAIGTAAYVLVSADHFEMLGPFEHAGELLATYNTIFFWWFALSLFEDRFSWNWVKFGPVVFVTLIHLPAATPMEIAQAPVGRILEHVMHSGISIAMMAHAIWIALRDRNTDLVGPRRRFRFVFALMVGAAGILIILGEGLYKALGLPDAATLLHASSLFALTFFFVFWLLSVNRAFFAGEPSFANPVAVLPAPPEPGAGLTPADKPAFDMLNALMDDAVYREEGLTVARLAEKVGVPEHQLRRLINRELGFRNFTAFLNMRRIEDAKAALADPANGRKQVLQIALELGYGSVAPFNRAFKEATGQTPTEFRKANHQAG